MGRHRPLASGTGSVPVGPVPPPWDDEPTAPADGRAPGAERPAAVEASEAGSPGEDAAASRPTLLDQMGGPMGMVDSGLPVVVFVVVNVMAGLTAGIIAALAAGVVIAAARLVRHKPVTQAIGGLVAVGIAAFIAYRVGSARGYFLFGIWTYLLYGAALALSVIVRWPLIGLAWESLNGRGRAWRADRRLRYRYLGVGRGVRAAICGAAMAVWGGSGGLARRCAAGDGVSVVRHRRARDRRHRRICVRCSRAGSAAQTAPRPDRPALIDPGCVTPAV